MAQENRQKIKLLKLMELLRQQTDEAHPLTTSALCAALGAYGITCDRRTLARDIALLNEEGFEVMTTYVGKEKGYYIEDRSFSLPELKILIDAVQACSFITPDKTEALTEKLTALAGSHRAELLRRNMVSFNTRKHSNEAIYYSVDALEEALVQQRQVQFRYFDLNERGSRVYRRDGTAYTVEPVALVVYEDNYYLIAYNARHDATANYRVDRMDHVELLPDAISPRALVLREETADHTEQMFKMYGGQALDVVLEFDTRLTGAVYDKFGEDTRMIRVGESQCVATVRVQLSPVFFGWLFQFAGQMKLLSPRSAIDAYRAHAEKME